MNKVVYKNLKRDFDELELIFKKHKIDSGKYEIISRPGIHEQGEYHLYIQNWNILIGAKNKNSMTDILKEYDIDDIYSAVKDFINIVVSDKGEQNRIYDEYIEWTSAQDKADSSSEFLKPEKLQDKDKYMIPFFIEGHDSGAAFWIQPVTILKDSDTEILMEDIEEADDEISIPTYFVDPLLYPIFVEFFDSALEINQRRVDYSDTDSETGKKIIHYVKGFEYFLTYNFYTYEQMESMLKKLEEYADSLQASTFDAIDEKTKKGIVELYSGKEADEIRIGFYMWVGIFYRNLADRIRRMMEDYPDTNIISIMGP